MRMNKVIEDMKLQARSRATETEHGTASLGQLRVFYYPRCKRFRWFAEDGPINLSETPQYLNKEQH